MAVVLDKIKVKMTPALAEARGKLYVAIFFHKPDVEHWINEVIRLGGISSLYQPWLKSAGDQYECPNSPLVFAEFQYHANAIRLMLNKGMDPNSESDETPLMVDACRTGDEEVAATVWRSGGLIRAQSSCDIQPLHAAMFSSLGFSYSPIFDSVWRCGPGSSGGVLKDNKTLKENLILWWQGDKTITPPSNLYAEWGGPISLVAFLLKNGADPNISESTGLSALRFVQDPNCAREEVRRELFELGEKVKFIDDKSIKEDILAFEVLIKERARKRTFKATIYYNVNMQPPKDVELSDQAAEVRKALAAKGLPMTLRGVVEAHALGFKDRDVKSAAEDAKTAKEMKMLQERLALLHVKHEALHEQHEQAALRIDKIHNGHVVMFEKHQAEEAYRARLASIKKDDVASIFYDNLSKELYRMCEGCKLLITDPSQTIDKTRLAATFINGFTKFVPSPFDKIPELAADLLNKYSDHRKEERQKWVIDLLPLNLIPMCEKLALELTEHYQKQLKEIVATLSADPEVGPEKAKAKIKELAKNAIGVMLSIMCSGCKPFDHRDPSTDIEYQLRETVKNSAFFQQKLSEATQKRSFFEKLWDKAKPVDMAAPIAAAQPLPSSKLLSGPSPGFPPKPPYQPRLVAAAGAPQKPVLLSQPLSRSKSPDPRSSSSGNKVVEPPRGVPASPRALIMVS